MRRIKKICCLLIVFGTLWGVVGCHSKSSNALSLNQVVDALAIEEVHLTKADKMQRHYTLNRTLPICYETNDGELCIYVYHSTTGTKKGLDDFKKIRKDDINMLIPQVFLVKNILILYSTHENRTDPYINRNKHILQAMEKLRK